LGYILVDSIRGLDVTDFRAEDGGDAVTGPTFVISYKPADLTFVARNNPQNPHAFDYWYSIYAPGFNQPLEPIYYPEEGYTTFKYIEQGFEKWLSEVRSAIDEQLLPDLWAVASEQLSVNGSAATDEFTEEERRQLRLALRTFRLRLIETFCPDPEQLNVISERLDYLASAVDRLNKFDWKGVAVSTLIGISTTLTLDTEKGRQLYGLFQQALSGLLYLMR
jgi:hypothetical protein